MKLQNPHGEALDRFRNGQRGFHQANDRSRANVDPGLFQEREVFHVAPGRGRGLLDFHWIRPAVAHDQEIDFPHIAITVKIQRRAHSAIPVTFHDFADHPGFQHGPRSGSRFQRFRAGPLQEPRTQPGVREINFRGLYHPFCHIAVPGFKEVEDTGGPQNGKPALGSGLTDVKGMYKKALAGEIANFTGVSDPYEPPPPAKNA